MDPLTALLSTVHVQAGLFSRAELGGPWAVHTRGADCAIFHIPLRGSGVIWLEDGHGLPWSAGDLIVLPHGHAHTMSDGSEAPPAPISQLPRVQSEDGLPCVVHGGDGDPTSLLCGTFRLDPDGAELILPTLPAILVLRAGSPGPAAWLAPTVAWIADEVSAGRPGADAVVARLAELLFVAVLRGVLSQSAAAGGGWMGAIGDPQLSRAVQAVQREPAKDWTAASLGRVAGLSRSAFFARFTAVVGEPPSAWLTRWRMHLARGALRRSDSSLADIAERVGYGSEAAFSRAFKRAVGHSPSRWRHEARGL